MQQLKENTFCIFGDFTLLLGNAIRKVTKREREMSSRKREVLKNILMEIKSNFFFQQSNRDTPRKDHQQAVKNQYWVFKPLAMQHLFYTKRLNA